MGFGQVVIVTGGSRGIGLAVVEALLAHGAGVVCVSRSRPPVTHEHLLWLAEDLSAPDSAAVAKRVCDATLERFGRISGIVNNAGIIGPIARCDSVTGEQYIANYRVNFVAAVELVRACILDLRASRGRVINVSSGAALRGYVGWSAYCASKAALKVWTESFAIEERAVTAISFRPGIVDTEMQVDIRTSGRDGMGQEAHDRFVSLKSDNKLLAPAVPGNKIAYLVLNAPQEWTGELIDVSEERAKETW